MKFVVLALIVPLVASLGIRRDNGHQAIVGGDRGRPLIGGFRDQNLDLFDAESKSKFEFAATKAVELMNDVKTEGGVSNAMPLRFTRLISVRTQVVAGTNYDVRMGVNIDGTDEVCHLLISNLYPWINGGEWSVRAQSRDDPCSPFIPSETKTKSRKRRSAQLLGGAEDASESDEMVQEAAKWAVEHINEMSNSLFRQSLLKITHVTKQVVNGVRYRFLLAVVSSTCRNNADNKHKTLEECPANENPMPQDCDVSVIYSQGTYTMENSKCKARKATIGGDDHDYKPHGMIGGDDHDYKPHGLIGGDDHDYKPHGMIGGDDHDYKPHGLIGGDDHDYKPHGMIGGDDHDYKPHGMIGGDDHDYKPHGMIGGDDHDYKPHGMIGGDDHDYKPHGMIGGDDHDSKPHGILGGDDHDYKPHGKQLLGQDKHDYLNHGANSGPVKQMSILGGDTHDYLPHGDDDKCAEHVSGFNEFKKKYSRVYGSKDEEAKRFKVFCDNMEKVKIIQAAERGSAVYGATKFADLSEEEFKKQYLGFKPPKTIKQLPKAEIPKDPIPESWDWRDHGAVTPVKNQGWCGSCWAFSTTGNIEGQWAIKSKSHKLYSLSEQELVDCDKIDQGCNGGFPIDAYEAIIELGGIETEGDYKYTGKDDKCTFNKSEVVVKLKGAVNISSNEDEMAAWLYKNGPISIGINSFPMQFYFWGIAHPWKFFCDPHALDHGVLIVGYGKKGNEPYWIIKNSWGESWGRDGYYYIYRGDGSCGLNTLCTSAVVN